ncbi:Oidioi.mRNA.OKI2018_I69.XSR.g14478.t1.cds [Oikopleura dioica]|uniref:Oidioi.mRNA.OKI2018_I69.XSR.g14478.t1.cds n=1 Tax=Oikopleura dioica TaxID=34765 RepID=A0ABN7SG82_OIKDI|nr:Oidioi.mRNA.OKI2018_I69.XSR.g14478.t1.cds [Oikopleura dioica]
MSTEESASKEPVIENSAPDEAVTPEPDPPAEELVTDEHFLEILSFVSSKWNALVRDVTAQSTRTRRNTPGRIIGRTGTVVYKNHCPAVERDNFVPWNRRVQQKQEQPRVVQTRVPPKKKSAISPVSAPGTSSSASENSDCTHITAQINSIKLGDSSGALVTPALPVVSRGVENDFLNSCEDAKAISVQKALEIEPSVREYSEFAQDFYNPDLDFNLNEWQEVKTKKKPKEEARNENVENLASQNEAPKEMAQPSSTVRSRQKKVEPRGQLHRSKSNYRFPFKSGDVNAKENITGRNKSATRKGEKAAKKGVLTNTESNRMK